MRWINEHDWDGPTPEEIENEWDLYEMELIASAENEQEND